MANNHVFVICAYMDSPYLEQCIHSLQRQSVQSSIIISTSTPTEKLRDTARKYDIPLHIRAGGAQGIAEDWNEAISIASDRKLVTLVHQDDLYDPRYLSTVLREYERAIRNRERPEIIFSDYYEIRRKHKEKGNKNLWIKRCLLVPLRNRKLRKQQFVKRRILYLGNPICCPAVTYVISNIPLPLFDNNMGSNIDWQAWEKLSRTEGSFVYIPEKLMGHRIHETSTTSRLIHENRRSKEDLFMLHKFWPPLIASLIENAYKHGERSNVLRM